jgi:arylsulfate sulfotransferase
MKSKTILVLILVFSEMLYISSCKKEDTNNSEEISINELLSEGTEIEVTLNPFEISPLTATAEFTTNTPVTVEVTVNGDIPISHFYDISSSSQNIPILGLYSDTINNVTLKLTTSSGNYAETILEIETDSIPELLPDIEINTNIEALTSNQMTLSSILISKNGSLKLMPIIFDNNGDIRWYMDYRALEEAAYPFEPLENGNLIIGFSDIIREYNMLGKIISEINLPGYIFNNDIIELPNNNLACTVSKKGTTIMNNGSEINSEKDCFIEINRNSGTLIQEWDLREVLDVDRNTITEVSNNWLDMNSIWYSKSDDCYIISGTNQGVVKVDRNNELKWIIAPHKGWGKSGWNGNAWATAPHLLTATNNTGTALSEAIQDGDESSSDFDWSWGQNAAMLLENGNILLFDNGVNRQYNGNASSYSRAVEYSINESNMGIKQIWQFGEDLGEGFKSFYVGDVDVLTGSNNRLITYGIINYENEHYSKIIEVTYPDNTVVFEATIYFKNENGINTETLGMFDFNFRSEKISLYTD